MVSMIQEELQYHHNVTPLDLIGVTFPYFMLHIILPLTYQTAQVFCDCSFVVSIPVKEECISSPH